MSVGSSLPRGARLCARLALVAAAFVPTSLAHAEVYLTREKALAVAFPDCDVVEKKLVLPSDAQRAALEAKLGLHAVPRVFEYWIGRKSNALRGLAVIEDVVGKSEPITYMLVVDPDLRVRSVEILAYRESRGGEVREASWRAQFVGKESKDDVHVGSGIRNIAGATISCRSITDGVRRELALFETLVGRSSVQTVEAASDRAVPANRAAPGGSLVRTQLLMGTTLRIEIGDVAGERSAGAIDAAFAEVARLESILSTWIPTSAASRLGAESGDEWHAVPPELFDILGRSTSMSAMTEGAFDVTVGPLVELWRAAVRDDRTPTPTDVANARAKVGWRGIELDSQASRARLTMRGASVDFGGIGKGFALDRARAVLIEHGVKSALLDFGGQLLALAAPPGTPGWSIELRDPSHPDSTCSTVLLVDASISTSADYERGSIVQGARISHIVDPRTGVPVVGMRGATVIAANATDADALSTALYVLGRERALAFAEEHGIAVHLVDDHGTVSRSRSFAKYEPQKSKAP